MTQNVRIVVLGRYSIMIDDDMIQTAEQHGSNLLIDIVDRQLACVFVCVMNSSQ